MISRRIKRTSSRLLRTMTISSICAVLLAPLLFSSIAHAQQVQLQATGEFRDRAHIVLETFLMTDAAANNVLSDEGKAVGAANVSAWISRQILGKVTFTDSDISDRTFTYTANTCDGESVLDAGGPNNDGLDDVDSGRFRLTQLRIRNEDPNFSIGCFSPLKGSIEAVIDTRNNTVWFNVVDDNNIIRVDGDGGNYTKTPGSNRFIRAGGGDTCPGAGDPKPHVDVSGAFSSGSTQGSYEMCDRVEPRSVLISGTPAVLPGVPPGGGSATQTAPSCESEGGELSWLICPVLGLIDGAITKIDEGVQSLLQVDPKYLDAPGVEAAWARIRNIAYLILVPIMLVMVIGTALGFDFFSSYTIKRALPRFLGAVVFIALSWPLMHFLIIFTNAIGGAAQGLVTSSVADAGRVTLSSLFTPSGGDTWAFGGLVAGVAAGTALAATAGVLSIGILLSYGFVVLLAVLIGFLILTLRQMIIIFLVIFAPLAILSWIFPGNDKLWKLWRTTLTTLLIFYPMIMGLFGVAKVFTVIISQTTDGLIKIVMVLSTWAVAYASVPVLIKSSAGVPAALTGMVNDRTKGLFDRNRNYRGRERAAGLQRFQTGDGRGRLRRSGLARRLGQGAGVGFQGNFGVGRKGRAAIGLAAAVNEKATAENNPWMAQLANNDDANAVMALSGGRSRGARQAQRQLAQRWTQAAITAREQEVGRQLTDDERNEITATQNTRSNAAYNAAAAVGFSEAKAQTALTTMAQNKSRAINPGDYDVVQEGMQRLAGGNADRLQGLAYGFQYNSRNAGRFDLGGNWATPGSTRDSTIMDGLGRSGMMEFVSRGHTSQVRQASDTLQRELNAQVDMGQINAIADPGERAESLRLAQAGVTRRREVASQRVMEMQHNLSYATGDNQAVINQMMGNLGIDPTQSVETQLAQRLSAPGATDLQVAGTARRLRAEARIHDSPQYADEAHRQQQDAA